jgi:small nuclear ribonucleoprotein (snRNP)-like protein
MLGKKTVVKFNDGRIVKGFTTDFSPNKDIFHIHNVESDSTATEGEQVEVSLDNIKAVFFVKDFQGNKEYKKVRTFNGYESGSPSQRKIVVIFKDGENFYGTTHSFSPDRKGFFVFPIDERDNNDRVFVPSSSLEKVHVKKFNSDEFDIYIYEN